MNDTGNAEDMLVLPAALLKQVHPRRGGATVLPFVAEPEWDQWITATGLRAAAVAVLDRITQRNTGEAFTLLRLRAALASATEEEFEQVSGALTAFRSGPPQVRAACSVLVPRADWLEQDVAEALAADDSARIEMLLYAVSSPQQALALAQQARFEYGEPYHDVIVTLADGAGAAALPALLHWLDEMYSSFWGSDQVLLSTLAAVPGDDAMLGLLSRADRRSVRAALRVSADRFPERALRLLAEAGDELLRVHVVKHLDLVDRVLPQLSPVAAGRVRAILGAGAGTVAAPLSAVPPVLVTPPWHQRKKAVKPPVVTGLTCSDTAAASWLPGERQEWAGPSAASHDTPVDGWAALAEKVAAGTGRWDDPCKLFTHAPDAIARPVLARWRPVVRWDTEHVVRVAAARFECDVLPLLLTLARQRPADFGPLLMPFTSPEVATLMADWSARLKSVRRIAQRWLLRHPAAAARALIPAALGKAGTTRRQAGKALLLLHGHGHTGEIRAAAAGYGPGAVAAVEALLVADPLLALPVRMPVPPGWAAPGALPPVRLRDGSGVLPAEAAGQLILMLMISRPDDPYAGLDIVRQAVEPADLAGFGWALFELWLTAGGQPKDGWVLDAIAQTGDDDTVRRITPLIMAWPTEGLPARAVTALSVLVGIGSDQALLHLQRISQRAKTAPLRHAAAGRISEVAEALGLTAEQLADRLVPDFGLDADGSLRLDYGPRRFVVGFDEQLRPFVADEAGTRLKALPRPGVKDDADAAEAAYQRFATLKKDVRKIASEQVRRLERAMVDGRRWSGPEFRRLFVDHPLMWHIGRRLVWSRFATTSTVTTADGTSAGAEGAVLGAVRIAEDRTLADVGDEPVVLGADEVIGLAHPAQLGADTARWAEVFADYELLQPFAQLKRPVFTLTETEREAVRLERFEGVTVPTTKVLTLDRRGWIRHEAANAGVSHGFDRPAGSGRVLTVHLDPGIVGQVGFHEEQRLVAVYLHDGGVSPWALTEGAGLPLSSLDPIMASEILHDLTSVTR